MSWSLTISLLYDTQVLIINCIFFKVLDQLLIWYLWNKDFSFYYKSLDFSYLKGDIDGKLLHLY